MVKVMIKLPSESEFSLNWIGIRNLESDKKGIVRVFQISWILDWSTSPQNGLKLVSRCQNYHVDCWLTVEKLAKSQDQKLPIDCL